MPTWHFRLTIEDIDIEDDGVLDALYEAGCSDALFGRVDGVAGGTFSRPARSFGAAVGSAITAIESAVPGACVVRAEREHVLAASA